MSIIPEFLSFVNGQMYKLSNIIIFYVYFYTYYTKYKNKKESLFYYINQSKNKQLFLFREYAFYTDFLSMILQFILHYFSFGIPVYTKPFSASTVINVSFGIKSITFVSQMITGISNALPTISA